jgi:hypothetical protein
LVQKSRFTRTAHNAKNSSDIPNYLARSIGKAISLGDPKPLRFPPADS